MRGVKHEGLGMARGRRTNGTTKNEAGDLALIAYCGLYCGDCFWHTGEVNRLARELSRAIRSSGFDRYASYVRRFPSGRKYRDFSRFEKVLAAIQISGCTRNCRDGGCDPKCRLRRCNISRGFDGCWHCERFEKCPDLAALKPIHGDGYLKNLRKLRRRGPAAFARGPRFWATKRVAGRGQAQA